MSYNDIKSMHETLNSALSDHSELERQYKMAVRDGNNAKIVNLSKAVSTSEAACKHLTALIDGLE